MDSLIKKHIDLINQTSLKFQRYNINQLPWNEQLIGIKGSRGVGKTTLLLQYIKQRVVLRATTQDTKEESDFLKLWKYQKK